MIVLMMSVYLLYRWWSGAGKANLCSIAIWGALTLMLFPSFWSLFLTGLSLGLNGCSLDCLHIRAIVWVVRLLNSRIEILGAISDRLEYSWVRPVEWSWNLLIWAAHLNPELFIHILLGCHESLLLSRYVRSWTDGSVTECGHVFFLARVLVQTRRVAFFDPVRTILDKGKSLPTVANLCPPIGCLAIRLGGQESLVVSIIDDRAILLLEGVGTVRQAMVHQSSPLLR